MPTTATPVNGYYWNYTIIGISPNQTASIGTGASNSGDATTATTTINGAVIIPGSLDGKPVTNIADYAFYNCINLTSVTIPSSVTSFGFGCFYKCSKLATAVLPTALTDLGMYSFTQCFKLTSVTIPNSVTNIGSNTFENCNSLTSVTIGTSVTSIGNYAFNYCNNINFKSVTIPNSVRSIIFNAFSNCSYLTSVTIGTSVTSIGTDCFRYCNNLTSINIPDSVTSIDTNAFANTSSNLTVTISQSRAQAFGFLGNLPLYNQIFRGNISTDLVLPPPTMTITSTTVTSGSMTNVNPITLTFTSSASTTEFQADDIILTNGSLNNSFAGSGTVYNATFTPNGQGPIVCTINVPANVFTAGGQNNAASNTFTFTYDAAPTMVITSTIANNATTNIASIPLTFTASESITGFDVQDITFNKGTLTDLSGSGSVYTAMFTQGGQGTHTINVPVGVYIDTSGNANTTAASFTWTYDSFSPRMDITATAGGSAITSGSTTKNSSIQLTFTATEVPTDFEYAYISFTGGTLSPLAGGGSVYTATFTPAENGVSGKTDCSISVPADKFTDAVGNYNTSTTFNFTFDNTKPGMIITATSSGSNLTSDSTTKNTPIELTFTASEVPTYFEYADISFTGGTLSPLAGGGSVYTATFTPDQNGISGKTDCSIVVPADKFTDAVGNYNTVSNTFNFTFDNTKPGMLITATAGGSAVTSGSTTKNTPIELTFTASEVPTYFEYADISFNGGTLSPLTGGGSVYTATFTPDQNGVSGKTECSIVVPADKFIDAVGNYNTSTTFNFTFDNTKPGMIITATSSGSNLTSGSTTKNTPIELTFIASEVPTYFEYADISFNGGTLSPLAGGGTVYTATFTPDQNGVSGKTECSIVVPADKFIDDVGNYNTASNTFNFTFDNTKPGMIITATSSGSNLTSGSTTKNTPIELTFTASEVPTDFEYADISFNGGTLSPLAGGGTVYTATFTPDQNGVSGKTECSIVVPADKFIDDVGNYNTVSNTFNFTFDNTKPGMLITATAGGSAVTSGSTTKNTPIELTFTASEVPTDFEYADISFNGGTLSPLAGGGSVYTATFTPDQNGVSGKTECSIVVPADKFIDDVGNYNTVSNTFNFTFDNTKPGMIITATSSGSNLVIGSTTKNTPIELTFTASEIPTDFEYADISFNGGTLSPLAGGGTVYTATFTPDQNGVSGKTECSIVVPADKFIDALGNYNTVSNTFNFTFDNTKPGMIITATSSGSNLTSGSTTKNTPIELIFTASEVPTDFEYADISFTGGTLSPLAGGGSVYTATFTPDQNGVSGKTECSIVVPADKFIDGVGNNNNAAPTFNFTFDNTKPGMIITAAVSGSNLASGSTTKNAPIELTFTASEVPTDFDYADISFNGGTLSPLAGGGSVYTAIFTPDQNDVSGKTDCSISVPADKFIDAVGNYNTSTTFNFTFDNTKPGMMITATAGGSAVTSGSTTKNTPIELTFTATESITDFEYADISFNGGILSPLAGGGTIYTATFTPDQNDVSGKTECSISVPADKFIDGVGNNNNAAPTFNFTFDNTKPGMIITATISGSNLVSGSTTKNAPIELTFTASEVPTDFEYADISFNGGTLSPLAGGGTIYTATFTPDQNDVSGKTECSISVPADKFTDDFGNYNTASNTFNFTFDNTKPGMMITATAGGSAVTTGSTTKNTPIELTFTATESITNFEYADISFTGGTLSPLAGGGSVYTATFTPDQNGVSGKTECSISVPADKFIDGVGNNNNAAPTFNFTFDNTKPGMIITATVSGSNIASGSTTKNTPIELTFTSSEIPTDFEYADISFTGGTLSPLAGGGSVYTATFTPDQNGVSGKTECSISVPADKFIDGVGNNNNAAPTFNFTFDNTKPGMLITATASGSNLTSGSATKNTPIELTFTASEVPTDFEYADISFNGGTLSPLTGGGSVYTATFTPDQNGVNGKTECSIVVPADKFTDAVGNYNTVSNTFNFTFDNTKPGMIITATAGGSAVTSGSTTKNTPIELTFTASEVPTYFEYADISFTGGTLSPLAGGGTVYTATFTPDQNGVSGKTECSIVVPADKFIDDVGNYNTVSNTINFTFDNTKPTMEITSNIANNATTNNTYIDLTFTSSEATLNFVDTNISVTNGQLTNFSGSGSVYTATFTRDPQFLQCQCTINVAGGAYTDAAGNSNIEATQFTWTFDSVPPDMTITSTTDGVSSGSTTSISPIALKFTSTKATNNFVVENITVTNGTLTDFASSSATVYTATFTPRKPGLFTIGVAVGAYTDAAGNSNTASNIFNLTFIRPVSFDTNTLTIVNSIDANDIDRVLFVLPSGEEISNINVTSFAGNGTITYDLSTDGASISSGTFTESGTNLLGTNLLIASTNTTYILTLAANASITYTIVGTKIVNYGNVTPTALSFVNNTLTIQNIIVSADVDKVSFDVNAGSIFYSLKVTSLLNTNSISYVLDISGGSTVSSGSFTQAGVNLLNGNLLQQTTDTTYILTLTSGGTNAYSIVGMSEGKFDIDKFCSKQGLACNNVGYNRLVTTNNDPSISNKMRYSQLLRTQRFKKVQVPGPRAPALNTPQPLYLFATGQIFTRSAIPNVTPLGPMGPVCPNR